MTGAPPELLDTWITGGLATGGLLTAHAIPQAQPPTTSYTYQWYSNAVLIVGATSQTYLVVAADSGLPITCAITPVNPMGAGPTTVTPVGVTVPAITHWIEQGAGALDYAQAVAGSKPKADGGAVTFDGTDDVLLNPTANLTPGAWEVWADYQLNALPGAGALWSPFAWNQGAGGVGTMADFIFYNNGAYRPLQWCAKAGGTAGVGFADALDTNRHLLAVSYNNGATALASSYLAWLDGISKALGAGGVQNNANNQNAIAGRGGAGAYSPITMYQFVLFKRQMVTAERSRLSDWFANATPGNEPTQIAIDGGTAADLAVWLRPGMGWS